MSEQMPSLNPEKSVVESQESSETREIEKYAAAIEAKIMEKLSARFEAPENKDDELAFHNREHTRSMAARAERLITAMREGGVGISEHDILVTRLAALGHDLVQNWEKAEAGGGVKRKRFAGDNERASAEELILMMREANDASDRKLFAESDEHKVREAIDATIPGFDPQLGTVVQPNLSKESSSVTRAIALADLGTAGMDGAEAYLKEGDELFVEENLDMRGVDFAAVSAEDAEKYKNRMMGWVNFQVKFAEGRRARLEAELEGLTHTAKEKVKSLFNRFEESIAGAKANAERRAKLLPAELYKDMGF